MADRIRAVHFVNQFFGGIGGEEKANMPVEVRKGGIGPGRLFQQLLGDQGSVVATIICGDKYFSGELAVALSAIRQVLDELQPSVVIAGPAFASGRYGLACGEVCQAAQDKGITAVTAMHPENLGALTHRHAVYIVPTGSSPVEMNDALSRMHALAIKLAHGQELGLPQDEGYLPRGMRKIVTWS